MAMQVAKSGWLLRESSILKRWKRNWVVLYQDGVLKYYDLPNEVQAQDAKLMKDATSIKTALEVHDVVLPENRSIGCLIRVDFNNTHWVFCAESVDDASAWSLALEQARVAVHHQQPGPYPPQLVPYGYQQPPAYTTVYRDPLYGANTTQYVVQGANGQTTVVYPNQRGYYRRGYNGTDVALGTMAGVAVGSMFLGPMLYW